MIFNGQKLIVADPSAADGYKAVGTAQLGEKQYVPAKNNLQTAVTLDQTNYLLWYMLAEADIQSQDYPDAEQALSHALLLKPLFGPALSDRAVVRNELGRKAEALDDARSACRVGFQYGCRVATGMIRFE